MPSAVSRQESPRSSASINNRRHHCLTEYLPWWGDLMLYRQRVVFQWGLAPSAVICAGLVCVYDLASQPHAFNPSLPHSDLIHCARFGRVKVRIGHRHPCTAMLLPLLARPSWHAAPFPLTVDRKDLTLASSESSQLLCIGAAPRLRSDISFSR